MANVLNLMVRQNLADQPWTTYAVKGLLAHY